MTFERQDVVLPEEKKVSQRAPDTRIAELQRAPATQHRNREILLNDKMSFFRKKKRGLSELRLHYIVTGRYF